MPKPQKHVFVCVQNRGPGHPRGSCMQSGGAQVWEEFANQFQQRNLYETMSLTNTGCLGPCNGPHVLVYPEGILYKATKDDVKTIIEEHLIGGTPVASLQVPADVWG
jgi:(2Fe-2S) ferredoxin